MKTLMTSNTIIVEYLVKLSKYSEMCVIYPKHLGEPPDNSNFSNCNSCQTVYEVGTHNCKSDDPIDMQYEVVEDVAVIPIPPMDKSKLIYTHHIKKHPALRKHK